MRLYGEAQTYTKTITKENYSTFNGLLASKKLFIAFIAYCVVAVLGAILEIVNGGYVLGVIDLAMHGLIIWGLIQFRKANKQPGESFSLKGVKKIQIVHAVKYGIVFVMLIVALVMLILNWSSASAEALKNYTSVKNSVDEAEVAEALAAYRAVFPTYFPILIMLLVVFFVSLVYYSSVMKVIDGTQKYQEKGVHFWNDLKFLGIFFFISAGVMAVFGLLLGLGVLDSSLTYLMKASVVPFIGGKGILSMIARILNAGVMVYLGVLSLKGAKVLSTTETSSTEEIVIEEEAEKVTE